jgi:hypothetical protein
VMAVNDRLPIRLPVTSIRLAGDGGDGNRWSSDDEPNDKVQVRNNIFECFLPVKKKAGEREREREGAVGLGQLKVNWTNKVVELVKLIRREAASTNCVCLRGPNREPKGR